MRAIPSDPRPPAERQRIRLAGAARVLGAELRAVASSPAAAETVRAVALEVLDPGALALLRAALVDDHDTPPAPMPAVRRCSPGPVPEEGV